MTTRKANLSGVSRRDDGVAFLLTQLGTRAAMRYAERVAELDLTPPQTGLLRVIAARAGASQAELAGIMGLLPSKMVAMVDEFEQRGLVQRRRDTADRRQYALHITDQGVALLREVGTVARAHDRATTAALSADERATLQALLGKLAAAEGLTPGVHPGYRTLRG